VDARRSWKTLGGCALVVALGVVLGCGGQKSATTNAPSTAASYDADVKELMTLTGTDSLALQMTNYISAMIVGSLTAQRKDVTEKQVAAAKSEVDGFLAQRLPELKGRMAAVYKKYYTPDDVKQLLAFYKTPVGAKFSRLTPTVAREGSMIGEEWGRSLGPELGQRLMARLQAEGLKMQ
jgi:hypothetical protein